MLVRYTEIMQSEGRVPNSLLYIVRPVSLADLAPAFI